MYHVLLRHLTPRHPPYALIRFLRFTCIATRDAERLNLSRVFCLLLRVFSHIRLLSCIRASLWKPVSENQSPRSHTPASRCKQPGISPGCLVSLSHIPSNAIQFAVRSSLPIPQPSGFVFGWLFVSASLPDCLPTVKVVWPSGKPASTPLLTFCLSSWR